VLLVLHANCYNSTYYKLANGVEEVSESQTTCTERICKAAPALALLCPVVTLNAVYRYFDLPQPVAPFVLPRALLRFEHLLRAKDSSA
jgi:hypothetical protein